jgi:hypothetical protein
MPTRHASSTVALAALAALAFGSTAIAQTMVGGQEVSAEDLDLVKEHCQMLTGTTAGETSAETTASTDQRAPGEAEEGGDMYAEAVDSDTEAVASSPTETAAESDDDNAATDGAFDIGALTAEDCEAADL